MKTAIITRATQGIGKAITEKFLQNDFSIAVCARTATHVTSLVKEWMREFPNAQIVGCKADLGIKQERMEFVEKVQEHFVSVDVLVVAALGHAATLADASSVEQMQDDEQHDRADEGHEYRAGQTTERRVPARRSEDEAAEERTDDADDDVSEQSVPTDDEASKHTSDETNDEPR